MGVESEFLIKGSFCIKISTRISDQVKSQENEGGSQTEITARATLTQINKSLCHYPKDVQDVACS